MVGYRSCVGDVQSDAAPLFARPIIPTWRIGRKREIIFEGVSRKEWMGEKLRGSIPSIPYFVALSGPMAGLLASRGKDAPLSGLTLVIPPLHGADIGNLAPKSGTCRAQSSGVCIGDVRGSPPNSSAPRIPPVVGMALSDQSAVWAHVSQLSVLIAFRVAFLRVRYYGGICLNFTPLELIYLSLTVLCQRWGRKDPPSALPGAIIREFH